MTVSVIEILWYLLCLGVCLFLCFKICKELEEEQKSIALQYNFVQFRLDFIMKSMGIYEDFEKEVNNTQCFPWEIEDEDN